MRRGERKIISGRSISPRVALLASAAFLASSWPGILSSGSAEAEGALPTGGQVVSGDASIAASSGSSLRIDQSSPTAILNWNGFSIGQGNSVTFANGSGATLNRVTGLSASQIDGLLSASGSVYLVNPSGIVVGSSGIISTGGSFIASTLDVSDDAFNAQGAMTFKGGSQAAVINYGSIGSLGGDVALIARRAVNEGTIEAPNGTAALAAGYEVLMRDAALSDGKFLVKVGGGDTEATTSGVIRAANVELRANGGNVYALAGNTGSVTKATGVASKDGRIFLTAGDGGSVQVTQKLSAKRITSKGKAGGDIRISGGDVAIAAMLDAAGEADAGGTIVATGKGVSILSTAKLDVSGALGGVILVGGDYQGGAHADTKYLAEAVADAQTTSVAAGAVLDASGSEGAGGHVVVWSDQYTDFAGAILATGSGSGAGGDAEVSGKAVLAFTGTADLRSQSGVFGTLLLDPYNLTITNAASSGMSGFNANANDSVLNVATLETALATANVKVTTGSGGSQAGDITVAANIDWSSGSKLELSAYHDIMVNANITGGTGSSVVLRADNTGTGAGTVTFGTGALVTADGGLSLYYNPASYANPTDYSGHAGAGTAVTAYMLVNNVDQLQAMETNLDGTYALGRDIDASATASWNGSQGFAPIGPDYATKFNGIFDGQGHVIDGLTINRSSTSFVGLFGETSTNAILRNFGVTNVDIVGSSVVGAIVGYNSGALHNVYSSGSVKAGDSAAGGLVGANLAQGSIDNSYSLASVVTLSNAGGLVGTNTGTIATSFASGSVSAPVSRQGGIAGFNTGTISKSYWDKDSTGQSAAAGTNIGTITDVTGIDASNRYKQSTYANLDFTNQWFMVDGYTRPFLRSEYQTTITNVHQLQLMALDLSANYTLGADVDASATNGSDAADIWKKGGFTPLGNESTSAFAGLFDGQGHTISGLTISRNDINNDGVALFGKVGGTGIVKNVGMVDADITAEYRGATLVGINDGLIENSYGTGKVSSKFSGGGLVSINNGTIADSYASAVVTGIGYAGGFVSSNYGTVTSSYATGSVSGEYELGGFAYSNSGALSAVYATGDVTGTADQIGGLVAINDGSISNSYATGDVTGDGTVGGLVAENRALTFSTPYQIGTILDSYASGNVTGNDSVGGLIGENSGTATDVYATGDVSGSSKVGGLVGRNTYDFSDNSVAGKVVRAYSTGKVTGTTKVGGLIGANEGAAAASASYWDKQTSGQASGVGDGSAAGVTGLTTAQFQDTAAFMTLASAAGWNFDTTWAPPSAGYYPELYAVSPVVWVKSATASSTYGDSTATVTGTTDAGGPSSYVFGPAGDSLDPLGTSIAVDPTLSAGDHVVTLANGNSTKTSTGGVTYRVFTYSANSTVTVDKATLTVTADNGQSIYGDAPGTIGYSVSGWKNNQTDSLLTGVNVSTDATALSNVGTNYITTGTGGTLGGDASGNYVIQYVNGSFEVKPATLTVTAGNGQSIYGDAPGAIGYSVSGWKNNQTDALLTGVDVSTDATALSNVGTNYSTTASGGTLSGAATGNYVFSYVNGSFEVKPATLTVTADNGSMIYGNAVPALGYSVAGWKNGQTDVLLTGVNVSTDATSLSNVGNGYGTTAAGGVLGGAATGNYVIQYVGGAFEITQRPITVTADAQSMIYGNAVPGLSYQIGGLGLVNGDQLNGGLATNGSSTSNVGSYAITQGSLAASSNYALTYVGNQLTITARPITITADDQSRGVGVANPALTYQLGGLGLVNGDQLSGGLVTDANLLSQPGAYSILQGSLAASGNYAVTYVPGTLLVTAELPPGEWRPVFEAPTDDWLETLRTRNLLALSSGGNAQAGEAEAPCPGGTSSGNCPILPYPANLPQSPWLRFAAH